MKQQQIHRTTIGGQAILEGIMMKGPRKSCTVVRKPDGTLAIQEKAVVPIGERYPIFRLPILRGIGSMVWTLRDGFAAIEYSAQFIEDEEGEESRLEQWLTKTFGEKRIEQFFSALSLGLGVVIPVALFLLLPTLIAGWIPLSLSSFAKNIIEGIIKVAIFLIFMVSVSKMKEIHRTYCYHGAEHKTIYCYEKGLELTVENVRKQSREHPRCGTSFLFVVIIISILAHTLVTWGSPVFRLMVRLAMLPLIVGVSYEFNRWVGRTENTVTMLLRMPGLLLQRLTVFEPDDGMIEVAIEALKRVIPEHKGEDEWK